MSHTEELIEEALEKLENFLDAKHLTEDLEVANYSASVKRTGINRYFNKLGIQVVRLREWQYAQKFSTNYFGKLSSIQFLKSASSDPESFDETITYLLMRQAKQLLIGTSNTELLSLSLVKKHMNYSHRR